jgi:branched-chain amino acid transport system substrate-binding protein
MFSRAFVVALIILALVAPQRSRAADTYEINAILSLTGNGAFIGSAQARALQGLETVVNRDGGIGGRPVKFVVRDDQSNPQVAVQLAQVLLANHVSVILGPSLAASCDAISPLVQRDGPVLYCLTSSVDPPRGGFVFSTLTSTGAMIDLSMRYFLGRGWKRVAYIVTTDASGQYTEAAINDAAAAPVNKTIQIVAREHMGLGDLSVAAQMAHIKAANPDVLVIWVIGAPAGNVLHAIADSGLNLPIVMSSGNLTPVFIKQFASLLPKDMFFPALPYYATSEITDRATQSAIATMSGALQKMNAKPDQLALSSWDPGMLTVTALRKLGGDVSPVRLRDYLATLHGWTGANGPYDFSIVPQRGIGVNSIEMIRWDAGRGEFVPVSRFGGRVLGRN